jgi:hypothetical protein
MEWGTRQSSTSKVEMLMKNGLYANIHRKQARIKAGSGEKMNKVGSKDAPSAKDFKESAKTAKPTRKEMIASKMKDM